MASVSQLEFPGGAPRVNQFAPPGPYAVTNLLVSMLQSLFSRGENLWHPTLRDRPELLWRPDTATGIGEAPARTPSIWIGTPFTFRPEQADVSPAVLVRRQTSELGPKMSIGDRFQTPQSLIGHVDAQHIATVGQIHKQVLLAGTHDVTCVAASTDSGFLDVLANEVYHFLIMNSDVIRQAAGMVEFRVIGMGPISELDGDYKGRWACSIGVRYTHCMSWLVRDGGPILKRFEVQPSDPESPLLRD